MQWLTTNVEQTKDKIATEKVGAGTILITEGYDWYYKYGEEAVNGKNLTKIKWMSTKAKSDRKSYVRKRNIANMYIDWDMLGSVGGRKKGLINSRLEAIQQDSLTHN